MGYQGQQKYILVVMTNKDVYYVNKDDAEHITKSINDGIVELVRVTDAKSKALIVIQLKNVSSLVEGAQNV